MTQVHLVAGILERAGRLLLVASRYANHPEPLWNLPGGRQRTDELLDRALRREFFEETGMLVTVRGLCYLSESYDRATETHFISAVFAVSGAGEPHVSGEDAHVVDYVWAPLGELAEYLSVRVVREPLLRHLQSADERYFGFPEAGITIEFSDSP